MYQTSRPPAGAVRAKAAWMDYLEAKSEFIKSVQNRNIYADGSYLQKNPHWHVEESPWKAEQILRILKQNHLAPETICEAGCGAGEVLKQLQKRMDSRCRFWGYEISPQAFELCGSRADDRLNFKLMDVRDDPGVHFDLLLVLDVIEHLEDYFSFLRGIRAKAHYKIFHFPLDLSVQTVLRKNGLMKRRNMYSHLHYFTKDIAIQTLLEADYEVLDYFYTPRSIDLGDDLIQKILKVPRKVSFAINQDLAVRVLGGYSLLILAR